MEKNERLTENLRVRISKQWRSHLQSLANQRGPGTKLSDLAREAIHQVYFSEDNRVGTGTYHVQEVTALRAAEAPKKARNP